MKKILIIFLILISVLLLSCEPRYTTEEWQKIQEDTEFQKNKEAIIKFDSEYKAIIEDFNGEMETWKNKYKDIRKPIVTETMDRMKNEFLRMYNNVPIDLKKLYVPAPLDDFYDKNIEYYTRMGRLNDSTTSNEIDEFNMMKIEINRIQREVYRKYNLEYLLK